MIQNYVQQVSTFAADIDFVVMLIAVIVGAWFLLAEAVFLFLIMKYKKKPGVRALDVDGSDPLHHKFISVPHALVLVCDVVIIVFAVKVWYDVKQAMPPADETVRIVAQQWAWTFVHPGQDGKLDTADDVKTADELHVKEGLNYHFELVSTDVLHSFSVPVFRLKQDAIPGRVIRGWFNAQKTGTFDIQCAEICGIGHGVMGARIVIETPAEHQAWLRANGAASATAPLATPLPFIGDIAAPAAAAALPAPAPATK